jgi:hypothetical protein
VARAYAIAAIIVDAAHQQSVRGCSIGLMAVALLGELELNGLKRVAVEDPWMLAWTDFALCIRHAIVRGDRLEAGLGDAQRHRPVISILTPSIGLLRAFAFPDARIQGRDVGRPVP